MRKLPKGMAILAIPRNLSGPWLSAKIATALTIPEPLRTKMADVATSTPASEIHELSGSTPPGSARPPFRPTTSPKPRPRTQPRLDNLPPAARVSEERHVNDLAKRLVALLRREPDVVRRLDMLRLHGLCADDQVMLDKVVRRMWRRIDRWTKHLATMKAPTMRSAAMKAAALIETAVVNGRLKDPFDALAISLAHDTGRFAVEAACLPQIQGGNFGAYNQEVLRLHAEMEALPATATDADANVFMDRWADIDRMAMADHPKTFADAVGALQYARREHHQFKVEPREMHGNEPCHGDKLILHLMDVAISVLQRVVQDDVAGAELARGDRPATLSTLADLDFEPWDPDEFKPHSNEEWASLAKVARRLHDV